MAPSVSRSCAAHHLRAGNGRILLDCGAGTLERLARYVDDWPELSHVLITHYHLDHVGALPPLLVALEHGLTSPRLEPLTLVGPEGFGAFLEGVMTALHTDLGSLGFPVRVEEVRPGAPLVTEGLTLRCHPTLHSPESVSYRIEGPWGCVAYTGDTGPSEALTGALAGADVLVAECTQPDDRPAAGHLTPSTLSDMVRGTEPRLTLVTHVFPTHEPEAAAEQVARATGRRVIAASDGMRISLSGADIAVDHPLGLT